MIDRITVGAASLMGALVAGTGLVRWAVAPPRARGRHRAQGRAEEFVPLEVLLGPPSPYTTPAFPDVPKCAVVAQCFEDCATCGRATAGVLHKDGWTCGECLTPTPAGGTS